MNDVNRYLCEEVGIDHADGHITRREAIRRLTLLGLTAAAASTLLAACSKDTPVNAANALTLAAIGTTAVRIYDGSLEEWTADPLLPLELGEVR